MNYLLYGYRIFLKEQRNTCRILILTQNKFFAGFYEKNMVKKKIPQTSIFFRAAV